MVRPDEKAEDGDRNAGKRHELEAEREKQAMSSLMTPIDGKIMM